MATVRYQHGGSTYELSGTPAQIQQAINQLEGRQESANLKGVLGAGLQGFNAGLAQALGAPVDLATGVINTLATGGQGRVIEQPFGGTQSLQRGMASVGMTYPDIETLPKYQRPFARAGETVGASTPFMMAPHAAALSRGARPTPYGQQGMLSPLTEAARAHPGTTAVGETSAALGAGMGAAAAEAVAPGDPMARFGGEVIGGVTNPLANLTRIVPRVSKDVRRLVSAYTPAGRELAAGKRAQELVTGLGEDPLAVAGALEAPQAVPGAPYTAGQKSGSAALTALERKLTNESAKYGGDVANQTKQAIAEIRTAFAEVGGTGDPNALREAAKAKQEYWTALIDARIAVAEDQARRAAGSIAPESPDARGRANLKARSILEEAQRDARQTESQLWERVDREIPIVPEQTRNAYDEAIEGLLEGEVLKAEGPVLRELRKISGRRTPETAVEADVEVPEDYTPTSGELLRLRSRIGAAIRKEEGSAAPDWDAIRRLRIVQDGIMDDLVEASADAADARAFSRAYHERFSRSAAGEVLGADVRGGERIPPEMTLEKGIAGGGPAANVRLRELEEAATPIPPMPDTPRPAEMRAAEEQVLRDLASQAVDPATGRINPQRLATFRERNKDTLARFPELERTLASAETAERELGGLISRYEHGQKAADRLAAFAKVAAVEDPRTAIKTALASKNPNAELGGILRLAGRDRAAREGARVALMDVLIDQSTLPNGLVSGTKMQEFLGKYGRTALRYGVLDEGQLSRLTRISKEAEKVEAALKSGARIDEVLDDASMLFDFLTRVVGANLGSTSAVGHTAGAPFVAAHAGSTAARRLAEKIPASRMRDVLMEAVQNPRLMADLLRRTSSPTARAGIERRVNAFLLQAGIIHDGQQEQGQTELR